MLACGWAGQGPVSCPWCPWWQCLGGTHLVVLVCVLLSVVKKSWDCVGGVPVTSSSPRVHPGGKLLS